jgi:tRNA G18 (ribose-2'-O)-methylase SpoU
MSYCTIESLDDPRVAGYRNLRERDLRAEGLFITEGSLLAERLLQSRYPVESMFVTVENAERFAVLVAERAPLYVAHAATMRQIAGFDFHRGVLGLGRRLPFADVTITVENLGATAPIMRLIACPRLQKLPKTSA